MLRSLFPLGRPMLGSYLRLLATLPAHTTVLMPALSRA